MVDPAAWHYSLVSNSVRWLVSRSMTSAVATLPRQRATLLGVSPSKSSSEAAVSAAGRADSLWANDTRPWTAATWRAVSVLPLPSRSATFPTCNSPPIHAVIISPTVTGGITFAVCLSVCLFTTHLPRNCWTDLTEVMYTSTEVFPGRCVSHVGGDRPLPGAPGPGAENVPWWRYCVSLTLTVQLVFNFIELVFLCNYVHYLLLFPRQRFLGRKSQFFLPILTTPTSIVWILRKEVSLEPRVWRLVQNYRVAGLPDTDSENRAILRH